MLALRCLYLLNSTSESALFILYILTPFPPINKKSIFPYLCCCSVSLFWLPLYVVLQLYKQNSYGSKVGDGIVGLHDQFFSKAFLTSGILSKHVHLSSDHWENFLTFCSLSTLVLLDRQNLSHTAGSRPSGMFCGASNCIMAFITCEVPSVAIWLNTEDSLNKLVLSVCVLIIWILRNNKLLPYSAKWQWGQNYYIVKSEDFLFWGGITIWSSLWECGNIKVNPRRGRIAPQHPLDHRQLSTYLYILENHLPPT